jgi:hypothetical protein
MASLVDVKEKIRKYKPKKDSERIIAFLEEETNASYLQILTCVYKVDGAFNELVNILEKKSVHIQNKPNIPQLGTPLSVQNTTVKNLCASDGVQKRDSIKSKGFGLTNAKSLIEEIAIFISTAIGALFGTAVLPGMGTVFGGILGGKLSTYITATW